MSAQSLVSLLAWTFVPSYATNFIHNLFYSVTIRAGDAKPQPGSQQYRKHYTRIYASLILIYLTYTLFEVFHDLRLKSDFYEALGVPHHVDEKMLKSRYRRLAAQYHPDKVGETGPAHDYYIYLQTAADTLQDPIKKFMYERFGPDIIQMGSALPKQVASQLGTWMVLAARLQAPSYVGSLLVLAFLAFLGYYRYGMFWRFWAFGALILLELYVVTRPLSPWFLTDVVNPFLVRFAGYPALLQFQFLALARKVIFNFFIAIAQLGPLFECPGQQNLGTGKEVEPQQLARMEQLLSNYHAEQSRMLGLTMVPYAGDAAAQREVKEVTKNWLVQNAIRTDPEVRGQVEKAIAQRTSTAAAP